MDYKPIIESILDSRICSLLETISSNYPEKFNRDVIKHEIKYIKEHICIKKELEELEESTISTISTISTKQDNTSQDNKQYNRITRITRINIEDKDKCSARVWNDYILFHNTDKKVSMIDKQFHVSDFADLKIKDFLSKYDVGKRCCKKKTHKSKYCKSHNKHLIHGDYLELPCKELCFHFMKDGNYL